jgi:ribonuclease Z
MGRREQGGGRRTAAWLLAGAAWLATGGCGSRTAPDGGTDGAPAAGGETGAPSAADAFVAPAGGTRVVLLGTGTPRPDPARSGPCTAVVAEGTAWLFDAGPGVLRRAGAAFLQGQRELEPRGLARVFLTHLHSDHTLGLPELIFGPWTLGREVPLEAWGPPGLQAMVDHLVAAWAEDLRVRTEGPEHDDPAGVRVLVRELQPGDEVRTGGLRVVPFAVRHGDWPAYGYRIEAPDRTIVISGDTTATDAVVRACAGCDVLVHEAYAVRGFADLPPDHREYHGSFHTSTADLARLAAAARPGLLVLTHQLWWPTSGGVDVLLEEVRRGWDGPVVNGRDLDVY